MSHKIKLAVFDIAGTTIRDRGEITLAFQSALRKFGYDVPAADVSPLMGYKKTEAIRMILEKWETDAAKITASLIDDIHNRFMAMMIRFYITTPKVVPQPHAEEVFARLKSKGIRVGLDTGFPSSITEVIIDRVGWRKSGLVDHVVSSNEVPAGRPHPHMIRKMMRQAGLSEPQEVIKIGDTESDVQEGKNTGCLYSIGVTTGAFTRAELEPYQPSFIIDDLLELIPLVEENS